MEGQWEEHRQDPMEERALKVGKKKSQYGTVRTCTVNTEEGRLKCEVWTKNSLPLVFLRVHGIFAKLYVLQLSTEEA